jgi:hypothetical protein
MLDSAKNPADWQRLLDGDRRDIGAILWLEQSDAQDLQAMFGTGETETLTYGNLHFYVWKPIADSRSQ